MLLVTVQQQVDWWEDKGSVKQEEGDSVVGAAALTQPTPWDHTSNQGTCSQRREEDKERDGEEMIGFAE